MRPTRGIQMLRRGQGILEYFILAGFLAAALITVGFYVKRGYQGNLRSQTEQIGAGFYAPGNTTANNSATKLSHSRIVSTSTSTTTYGNGQAQTAEIAQKIEDIKGLNTQLADLRKQFEDQVKGCKTQACWDDANRITALISAKQQEINTAQKELKILQDAYSSRTITPNQTTVVSSDTGNIHESTTKNTNESLGALSADPAVSVNTGTIGKPPVGTGSPAFQNAQTLELNGGWVGGGINMTLGSGERKIFKFTIPPGLKYLRVAIGSYDQMAGSRMNMVVQKGDPIDYFDTVYQDHAANGWPISGYANTTTINGTQVWDRMDNSPFSQDLVVFNPQPGTYYMIVQMSDGPATRMSLAVQGY